MTARREKPSTEPPSQEFNDRLAALAEEVRWLRNLLEKLRLQQYVQVLLNTRRIAWMSFLRGVLSGLGAAVGATLVLALLIYLLSRLEVIPHIGRFVSEIVKIVQHQKP